MRLPEPALVSERSTLTVEVPGRPSPRSRGVPARSGRMGGPGTPVRPGPPRLRPPATPSGWARPDQAPASVRRPLRRPGPTDCGRPPQGPSTPGRSDLGCAGPPRPAAGALGGAAPAAGSLSSPPPRRAPAALAPRLRSLRPPRARAAGASYDDSGP